MGSVRWKLSSAVWTFWYVSTMESSVQSSVDGSATPFDSGSTMETTMVPDANGVVLRSTTGGGAASNPGPTMRSGGGATNGATDGVASNGAPAGRAARSIVETSARGVAGA